MAGLSNGLDSNVVNAVYVRRHCDCLAGDRFLLFHQRQLLVRGDKYLWHKDELDAAGVQDCDCLLLETGDSSILAVNLRDDLSGLFDAQHVSTRDMLLRTAPENFSRIGQATQLITWHLSHRYCGSCGNPTVAHPVQRAMVCTSCQACYYPRINPCVIMLVTRGREILLARSSRPGATFYSCLAGFMEIGETPEQTVAREIREEVGIEVENIRYIQSQSWPFPSQLMLGFFADYRSGTIEPAPDEIADARWFSIDEISVPVPAALSVAGQLINRYCSEAGGSNKQHKET